MHLTKIISGGQTGADRAALDFAIDHNIPHGGAIPKGRRAEDGTLPDRYNLTELPTTSYPKRTEQNVLDSDGTVIFTHGKLKGGCLLTRKKAVQHNRPVLHLNLQNLLPGMAEELLQSFITENNIKVLNVAGSRGSSDGLIYGRVVEVLTKVIAI